MPGNSIDGEPVTGSLSDRVEVGWIFPIVGGRETRNIIDVLEVGWIFRRLQSLWLVDVPLDIAWNS